MYTPGTSDDLIFRDDMACRGPAIYGPKAETSLSDVLNLDLNAMLV